MFVLAGYPTRPYQKNMPPTLAGAFSSAAEARLGPGEFLNLTKTLANIAIEATSFFWISDEDKIYKSVFRR